MPNYPSGFIGPLLPGTVPAPRLPGGHQNFVQTEGPLSQETILQQQFPYHTFVIVDTQRWAVVAQHTLVINPQELTQQEPVRANVVQTIGGAYVDDFGRGLPKVSISGNTGWKLKPMPDGMGMQDGWQAFKALRNDIFRFFTDSRDNVRTYIRNPVYLMRWYNWGDDEYYNIQPTEFQLQRSASQPLFYTYNFQFTCIEDLTKILHNGGGIAIAKMTGSGGTVLPTATSVSVDVGQLNLLAQQFKR